MDQILLNDRNRLRELTKNCRTDMHEPDEQGITARVVGYKLDNANGKTIIESAIKEGWQEFVVILEKDGVSECFNLANLIALAKMATEVHSDFAPMP